MPAYAYQCKSCEHKFEIVQKFSAVEIVRCPKCGKLELQKVYTATPVIFKGEGFYKTDNRTERASV